MSHLRVTDLSRGRFEIYKQKGWIKTREDGGRSIIGAYNKHTGNLIHYINKVETRDPLLAEVEKKDWDPEMRLQALQVFREDLPAGVIGRVEAQAVLGEIITDKNSPPALIKEAREILDAITDPLPDKFPDKFGDPLSQIEIAMGRLQVCEADMGTKLTALARGEQEHVKEITNIERNIQNKLNESLLLESLSEGLDPSSDRSVYIQQKKALEDSIEKLEKDLRQRKLEYKLLVKHIRNLRLEYIKRLQAFLVLQEKWGIPEEERQAPGLLEAINTSDAFQRTADMNEEELRDLRVKFDDAMRHLKIARKMLADLGVADENLEDIDNFASRTLVDIRVPLAEADAVQGEINKK